MNSVAAQTRFRNLNALGLLALALVLAYAEFDQLFHGELPCPLCLLQRVGLAAAMMGLLLNVLYGCKPVHYSLTTLGALFGAGAALRQVSLHVIPGTPGYGEPLLGYHFYTWAFLVFALVILGVALISGFGSQYGAAAFRGFRAQSLLGKLAISLCLLMVLLNALVTFAECGPGVCPDNPTQYWLLSP